MCLHHVHSLVHATAHGLQLLLLFIGAWQIVSIIGQSLECHSDSWHAAAHGGAADAAWIGAGENEESEPCGPDVGLLGLKHSDLNFSSGVWIKLIHTGTVQGANFQGCNWEPDHHDGLEASSAVRDTQEKSSKHFTH